MHDQSSGAAPNNPARGEVMDEEDGEHLPAEQPTTRAGGAEGPSENEIDDSEKVPE